jgi:GDPmannose 4,6-dehydratase
MYACHGILFNHESPLRRETFVTRKITRAVAKMSLGLQELVYMGNLYSKRDWGHAKDYVRGMWLMLQQDKPEDFILATETTTPIRDFMRMAFAEVGVELEFKGSGVDEVGIVTSLSDKKTSLKIGQEVIRIDPKYFRPTEVDLLIGDPSKANSKLGWKPEYDLKALVKEMMESDLKLFEKDKYLLEGGHQVLKQSE